MKALEPARAGEGVSFTMIEGDFVRQFHEGLATSFHKPHCREERVVQTTNLYLSKAQTGWVLQ